MITVRNNSVQPLMIGGKSLGVDAEIEIAGPADEQLLRLESGGYVSILDEESTAKRRAARLARIEEKREGEQTASGELAPPAEMTEADRQAGRPPLQSKGDKK